MSKSTMGWDRLADSFGFAGRTGFYPYLLARKAPAFRPGMDSADAIGVLAL